MLGLVADQDHVGDPLGDVVEMRHHAVNVLEAAALVLLVLRQADVAYHVADADRAEYDPVYARHLVGHVVGVDLHEGVVAELV